MSRAAAPVGLLVALLLAGGAIGSRTAVPLLAPTGYKDYCDNYPLRYKSFCPHGGVPARFWRPLRLPSLSADGSCPLTAPHQVFKSMPPVLGDGPFYINLGRNGNVMKVVDPHDQWAIGSLAAESGWGLGKLLIPVQHGFRGPLLIRGGGIANATEIGFSDGKRPFAALQVPAHKVRGDGDLFTGGAFWITAPGCYAVQLDSTSVSDVVVFDVQFVPYYH